MKSPDRLITASEKTTEFTLGIRFALWKPTTGGGDNMIRPASETEPVRSAVRKPLKVLCRRAIRFNPRPVPINYPVDGSESNMVVHREDGVVKSLEYRCKCGHTDTFICE